MILQFVVGDAVLWVIVLPAVLEGQMEICLTRVSEHSLDRLFFVFDAHYKIFNCFKDLFTIARNPELFETFQSFFTTILVSKG